MGFLKNNILYHYERAQNRGIDHDQRKGYFDAFPKTTIQDFEEFYEGWIKNNYFNLLMIGDLEEMDQEKIKKFGKVTILDQEEIFGY